MSTFNGSDLRHYSDDDKLENLRANSSLAGEDDSPMGHQLGEAKRSPYTCKSAPSQEETQEGQGLFSADLRSKSNSLSPTVPNQWVTEV